MPPTICFSEAGRPLHRSISACWTSPGVLVAPHAGHSRLSSADRLEARSRGALLPGFHSAPGRCRSSAAYWSSASRAIFACLCSAQRSTTNIAPRQGWERRAHRFLSEYAHVLAHPYRSGYTVAGVALGLPELGAQRVNRTTPTDPKRKGSDMTATRSLIPQSIISGGRETARFRRRSGIQIGELCFLTHAKSARIPRI